MFKVEIRGLGFPLEEEEEEGRPLNFFLIT
jgi:hypothetical protein